MPRVLLLFFLSGATSLVYEVVWMRRLSLVFGHSIFSVSTVLTVFMSGLALGSFLGGRWSDRQRARGVGPVSFLSAYARLELFIGVWALLSLPMLNGVEASFLGLAKSGYHGLPLTGFLFVASFLVLIAPTSAMGATLPIFTQVLLFRKESTGTLLSRIYGLNTLGACFGACVSGLVALPTLGLARTTVVAALLNAVIAFLAHTLPSKLGIKEHEVIEPAEDSSIEDSGLGNRVIPLVFGISGFAGMVYQLGWTRLLVLSIGSSTYSFSIILACFLASLGLGSVLYHRLFSGRQPSTRDLALSQIFIAFSALLSTQGMSWLPVLKLRALPFINDSFVKVALFDGLVLFCLLALPTLALGLTFPLVTHLYAVRIEELGRRLGEAYSCNTAGAILGSFSGGFFLIPILGLENAVKFAVALNLLGGVLVLFSMRPRFRGRREFGFVAATILVALLTPQWNLTLLTSGVGVGYQNQGPKPPPIFYRDGVGATVTVGLNWGELPYIAVNGKTDASLGGLDRSTQLFLGLIPPVLHPDPRSLAVIGFGSGQTVVGALSVPGVEKVRCVELEPAVLEAKKFFAPFSEGAFEDPRLTLIEGDGRSFILGSAEQFDIIISEPSNPWLAGIGNLYTSNFYEGCRERLKPGGLMAQWFHLYAMSERDVQLILRTFFSVFPEGSLYRIGGGDLLLIGAEHKVEPTAERLEELFDGNKSSTFWFAETGFSEPRMFYATYLASRAQVMAYLSDKGAGQENNPLNTDDRPLLEFRAPLSLFAEASGLSVPRAFGDLAPPEQAKDAGVLQASVLGRLLMDFPFDKATVLTQLKASDPRGVEWYPGLIDGLMGPTTVNFDAALKAARPADKGWMVRFALAWKRKLGIGGDATSLYRQALAITPRYYRLSLLEGAAENALALGQLGRAEEYLDEALPLTQGDDILRAKALLYPLEDVRREEWLRKALATNPYSSYSHFALAEVLAARKDFAAALVQARESYRLFPGNLKNLRLMAQLYRQMGDVDNLLRVNAEADLLERKSATSNE